MKTVLRGGLGRLLGAKQPEPSYPRLPFVDERGQTTLPGLFAVGEVAGTPLIKLGINAGHGAVLQLAGEARERQLSEDSDFHLVIIGAGAAGLAAAAAAKDLGLKAVVIEANHLAETVYTMTKGKLIFAEPEGVEKQGALWFEECTKEQLLEKWEEQVEHLQLDVRLFERVTDIQREEDWLVVTSQKGRYRAARVLLALGKAGNPRKAGVPGEVDWARKIDHRLIDPALHTGQRILVYGGGDVALEAALSLCDDNEVTLITIDSEFVYPKKRNIDATMKRVAAGKLDLRFETYLKSIGERDVSFQVQGSSQLETIANDHVFEMIGAELPLPFFERVGVKLEGAWTARRWLMLASVFLFVYTLYSLKSFGKGLWAGIPFEQWISAEAYDSGLRFLFEPAFAPFRWLFRSDAYEQMATNRGYQQGYLYSLAYTAIMVIFGWKALLRWTGTAKRPSYQKWRYLSLISFQVLFFFIVNVVAVQAFTVEHAWRTWGLYQPYPLFVNVFFWWEGVPRSGMFWFFVVSGLLGTFVGMPLLARYHGKRFCTWICGCGGLAETLGDRWRHLSPKGDRSRAWEFQSVAVLCASAILLLVVVGIYNSSGSNIWWHSYNYIVDFWLVAVIPITLYPFFGGKVWCRYWCPLAAWNQVLAKWFGKLEIRSNEHCISCTQCSKYCQVGVDVMAFAKNQISFDNRNSSCIHCGICVDVCPMDVLSFGENERGGLPETAGSCPSPSSEILA